MNLSIRNFLLLAGLLVILMFQIFHHQLPLLAVKQMFIGS